MPNALYGTIIVAILIANALALLVAGLLSIRVAVSRRNRLSTPGHAPSDVRPRAFSTRQAATLYALGVLSFVLLAISLFLHNGYLSNIAVGLCIIVVVSASVLAFRK